jgi:hypothetical protein
MLALLASHPCSYNGAAGAGFRARAEVPEDDAEIPEFAHHGRPTGFGVKALPEVVIDRTSPLPFYFQLAELLEHEIASGR